MSDAVTPFRIEVSEADLRDLHDRLERTRWPERETVEDWARGVPLAYLRDLSRSGSVRTRFTSDPETAKLMRGRRAQSLHTAGSSTSARPPIGTPLVLHNA